MTAGRNERAPAVCKHTDHRIQRAVEVREQVQPGRARATLHAMRLRLRQILRQLLAVGLMVSLLPGLVELVENIEHLLHDGHLPHSAQHEQEQSAESHDDGLDAEHGCTPMAHHCGCHTSSPALLANAAPELGRAIDPAERRLVGTDETPTSRANAPPTRPPIA